MHVARTRVLDPLRAAAVLWILAAVALCLARPAAAQDADETPLFTPEELEELVAPIALYPDDLVAIVLPAATYPLDVVEAARFLDELEDKQGLAPDQEWDDSIVALLNYPEVLRLMDEDLDWTWDLGEAFLNQQTEVFDAIQRFRAQAREAGNLESDERVVVTEREGAVQIAPADPKVIYVPYYEPREVIVHHHHAPLRYYPRPYPVYYYPYPAGYSFWSGYFWGVTTAFAIGWHTHHLHAHHHLHVGHPYYSYHYYEPYYVRRSVSINIVNIDRDVYVWQPRHHRIGVRPGRVTVTREGVVRSDYGTRRYVSRGDTTRRAVSTGGQPRRAASSERTIGRVASGEQRRSASAESRAAATARSRSASTERSRATPTARSGAASTERRADARGVTTREGIANALRDAGERNAGSSNARSSSSRSSTVPSSNARSNAASASSRSTAAGGTSRTTERSTSTRSADRTATRTATPRRTERTSTPRSSATQRTIGATQRSIGATQRSTGATQRSTGARGAMTSGSSRAAATRSAPRDAGRAASTSRSIGSVARSPAGRSSSRGSIGATRTAR